MKDKFQHIIRAVHKKRCSAIPLNRAEFMLLLADCIVDRRLFASHRWNWRYGGVRYVPTGTAPMDPSRVLVLQWPAVLGDAAMSAPALSVLRRKYPHTEISLLTGTAAQSIFMNNPDVDLFIENPLEVHTEDNMCGRPVDLETLMEDMATLISVLNERAYDLVINLQVLPMSATLTKLSGARHTIGIGLTGDGMPVIHGNFWSAYLFGVSSDLMRRYNPVHRTEIFIRMIDDKMEFRANPIITLSPHAVRNVRAFFSHNGIGDKDHVIGISPMAGTPIRVWKHYHELAGGIRDQLKAKVLILGSRDEEFQVEQIVQKAGKDIIKATHFDLQELMAAICGCDLFVTNDTGPMHLACMLKKKVLALFGPTSVTEVGPWGTEFHVLQSSLCRECYKQECREPETYCMEQIGAEDVFAVVKKVVRGDHVTGVGDHLIYRSSKNLPSNGFENGSLGQIILQVLQGKRVDRDPPIDKTQTALPGSDRLVQQCQQLLSLVEKAMNHLDNPCPANLKELNSCNKMIFSANSFLKPIIALNDFIFLDKRFVVTETLYSLKRFYSATSRDLEVLMSFMRSITTRDQKGSQG